MAYIGCCTLQLYVPPPPAFRDADSFSYYDDPDSNIPRPFDL